jgi:16S rRNA (cytidine1402-2'-O)-methyltransferase
MKLTVVPTPIGNLGDITLRALEVLRAVDGIIAEDTRTTGHLLRHFEIQQALTSFHTHNEHKMAERLSERIEGGEHLALVSDAGTPGISDPGFLLIRECLKRGIEVECLPGATAFVPALVVSGLPTDKFIFEGFLPHKKGRQKRLNVIADNPVTTVLYESPYRVLKTLQQLLEVCGAERQVAICREITKMHEETFRGTLQEAIDRFNEKAPKGEFVLILEASA